MKRLVIGIVAMLWAVPAFAQYSLLPDIQRIRAEYPTPMSPAQRAELLNRVAWLHHTEGWGLLQKTGGTRCPAPQGVEVACDILVYAPTAWHFDVLVDQENTATPAWIDDGPCDPNVSGCDMARFVAPIGPPAPPPAQTGMGDVPVPGEYDGDGQIDVAVYRTTTGEWFIAGSASSGRVIPWGGAGDVPVPADYDGDRKTDVAVFRPSTGEWFILNSSNSTSTHWVFGSPESTGLRDTPMAGDYDRDGRADLGIYRKSSGEWFIRKSSDGSVIQIQWGAP